MGMKTVFNDKIQFSRNFTEMIEQAEEADKRSTRAKPNLNPNNHLIQLFNIEKDPNERSEISSSHSYIVNLLLFRLANYYDEQADPFYPKEDRLANPDLHG